MIRPSAVSNRAISLALSPNISSRSCIKLPSVGLYAMAPPHELGGPHFTLQIGFPPPGENLAIPAKFPSFVENIPPAKKFVPSVEIFSTKGAPMPGKLIVTFDTTLIATLSWLFAGTRQMRKSAVAIIDFFISLTPLSL